VRGMQLFGNIVLTPSHLEALVFLHRYSPPLHPCHVPQTHLAGTRTAIHNNMYMHTPTYEQVGSRGET